ncbi:alpha/beta fold hydrolase [Shimia abyssi]|uniref:Pimeloyl-ACP methyl ester carboxylesterase n=1 Tax=Shimia abyssi TaxID=1662395 RepID=A0A2P8FJA7_9RHOB|nr:alpha/beta hydrolase [Shimia abyssi]PSL21783.1 pimeloyl-ACP methyl ester carboxylesterase [Shimia abyssi]
MHDPLVLIPGMMCDARVFEDQILKLTLDRAVMIAVPTLGERIEDMAAMLLNQLPERFALAGFSMGGMVAMDILRRAPERVTRIALMDTSPLPETPAGAAEYEPWIVGAMAGKLDEVLRSFMRPDYLAPGVGRAQILARFHEMGMGLGADLFIRQARAMQRRPDQQKTLRQCKVPALVMCGEHDQLTPPKRHSFMAELIPTAELHLIEEAGHFPTLERPKAVSAILGDWLAKGDQDAQTS